MTTPSPSFESQMERLQSIVGELESADLALDRSVALYREGRELIRSCREQLEKARLTVTVHGEDGPRPFDRALDPSPDPQRESIAEDDNLC